MSFGHKLHGSVVLCDVILRAGRLGGPSVLHHNVTGGARPCQPPACAASHRRRAWCVTVGMHNERSTRGEQTPS